MANNPYVNKVTIGSQTVLDLTGDTISPDKLASGYTAHSSSGYPIIGTMEIGGLNINGNIEDRFTEYNINAGDFVSSLDYTHTGQSEGSITMPNPYVLCIKHYANDVYIFCYSIPYTSAPKYGLQAIRFKNGLPYVYGTLYTFTTNKAIYESSLPTIGGTKYYTVSPYPQYIKNAISVYEGKVCFCNSKNIKLYAFDQDTLSFTLLQSEGPLDDDQKNTSGSRYSYCRSFSYIKDGYYLYLNNSSYIGQSQSNSTSTNNIQLFKIGENSIEKGPTYVKKFDATRNRLFESRGQVYRKSNDDNFIATNYSNFYSMYAQIDYNTLSINPVDKYAPILFYLDDYGYAYITSTSQTNYYKYTVSSSQIQTKIDFIEYNNASQKNKWSYNLIGGGQYGVSTSLTSGNINTYIYDYDTMNLVETYLNENTIVLDDGTVFRVPLTDIKTPATSFKFYGTIHDISIVPYNGAKIYGVAASNSTNNNIQVLIPPTGGEN